MNAGTGAVMHGSNLGSLPPKYWLPLQPGEIVVQVAWQAMQWDQDPAGTAAKAAAKAAARAAAKAAAGIAAPAAPPADDGDSDSDASGFGAVPKPAAPAAAVATAAAGVKRDTGRTAKAAEGAPRGPDRPPCMGAVLTNQRVLIVTGVITVHMLL